MVASHRSPQRALPRVLIKCWLLISALMARFTLMSYNSPMGGPSELIFAFSSGRFIAWAPFFPPVSKRFRKNSKNLLFIDNFFFLKNGSVFCKTKPGFESASLKYTQIITLDCLSALVTEKIHILAKISLARFWFALMAGRPSSHDHSESVSTVYRPRNGRFRQKISSAHMVHGADRPD